MKIMFLVLSGTLLLTACASTRLKPEAAGVIVSQDPPAAECKSLGSVDSYTHVNISNARENVLVNVLKNNAHEMGGNYVQLEEATKLKHAGRVFSCP